METRSRLEKERGSGKTGAHVELFIYGRDVRSIAEVKPLQMYLGNRINKAGGVGFDVWAEGKGDHKDASLVLWTVGLDRYWYDPRDEAYRYEKELV